MALQVNYTAKFLVDFPEAYVRVLKVDIDLVQTKASIEYWIYPSAAIRAEDGNATIARVMPEAIINIEEGNRPFTDYFGTEAQSAEGMNPIAGAYAYLKTLPEFAGAIDV